MKQKNDSLQALRAFGCLGVFFYHCGSDTYAWAIGAVSIFFVLSGFLLSVNSVERGTVLPLAPTKCLSYAWKRIRKLYPLYMLTLLPILLMNLYASFRGAFGQTFGEIAKQFVLSVFLVQSWSPTCCMAFNGVAWFLSTLFFLYFAFPYISFVLRKYRRASDALAAAVLLLCAELAVCALLPHILPTAYPVDDQSLVKWFTYNFPPFRLFDFALGCNLGWFFARRNKMEGGSVPYLTDLLCIFTFAAAAVLFRRTASSPRGECFRYSLLFVPFALIAVYAFALDKGFLPRLLTNRYTVLFGDLSGFFYLIHQDVIRGATMLWEYLGLSFESFRFVVVPLAFVVTTALSLLYSRFLTGKMRFARRGVQ